MAFMSFIAWISLIFASVGPASAQSFPNKPVRIVTVEVGGGADFTARLIAHGLTAEFGQPVIVENRPSAVIAGEIVAKASPDGYTVLLNGLSHWLLPFLQDN